MITIEHKSNLEKLIKYLRSDKVIGEFDMITFCDDSHYHKINCGTQGCVIGHGPYAGVPKLYDEHWFIYAGRAFGLSAKSVPLLYDYCTSSSWAEFDNDILSAADRLEKVLLGEVTEELLKENPLLYMPFYEN